MFTTFSRSVTRSTKFFSTMSRETACGLNINIPTVTQSPFFENGKTTLWRTETPGVVYKKFNTQHPFFTPWRECRLTLQCGGTASYYPPGLFLELIYGESVLKFRQQFLASQDEAHFKKSFQVLLATAHHLKSIHDKDIIHGDIKPANVIACPMLDIGNNTLYFSACMIDFEYARFSHETIPFWDGGDLGFVAPEVLSKQAQAFTSDIYSFGMMILRMFNNGLLSNRGIHRGDYSQINLAGFNNNKVMKNNFLTFLITNLLTPNPKDRVTITECIAVLSDYYEAYFQASFVYQPHEQNTLVEKAKCMLGIMMDGSQNYSYFEDLSNDFLAHVAKSQLAVLPEDLSQVDMKKICEVVIENPAKCSMMQCRQ